MQLEQLPARVTNDLRIVVDRPDAMTPAEALALAQELTLRAMVRQAELMPARATRASRLRRTAA